MSAAVGFRLAMQGFCIYLQAPIQQQTFEMNKTVSKYCTVLCGTPKLMCCKKTSVCTIL